MYSNSPLNYVLVSDFAKTPTSYMDFLFHLVIEADVYKLSLRQISTNLKVSFVGEWL